MSIKDRDWYREEYKKKHSGEDKAPDYRAAYDSMWEEVEHSHLKKSTAPDKPKRSHVSELLAVLALLIFAGIWTGLLPRFSTIVQQKIADMTVTHLTPGPVITQETVPAQTEATAAPEILPEETEEPAVHGQLFTVNTDNLNVRDAENRQVIGTLKMGDTVEEAGYYPDSDWVLFEYEGKDAVVYRKYLDMAETAESGSPEPVTEAQTKGREVSFSETVAVLVDDRKADLSHIDFQKTCPLSFEYQRYSGNGTSTLNYDSFPQGAYEYYHTLARYGLSEWERYYTDSLNKSLCDGIARCLRETASSEFEAVSNAVAFVQSLDYIRDGDTDYPKYPVETLYERGGDCEDTSLLLCGIVRSLGYGSALLVFDNHCAVGLLGDNLDGAYFDMDGKRYYYTETTGTGWRIGQIPGEYESKSAKVIEVR